ncbi:MAG TPA: hypothetical protein VFQ36_15345 [Ktedonobacteraceae bacterium]|nr:hypothetical protein [Ktedonobacteraceae bacterium]
MANLSDKDREKMPAGEFAFPKERKATAKVALSFPVCAVSHSFS